MTENEYLNATNRVKIRAALDVLREVVADNKSTWGVDQEWLNDITLKLFIKERDLFQLIKIDTNNND